MEEYIDIIEKLKVYVPIKEKGTVEKKVHAGEMTFLNLRDRILGLGKILEEDFDKQIYVIAVMAGAANMNTAFVGVQLKKKELFLAGYAKEGLIKQNTAEKAVGKLEEVLK